MLQAELVPPRRTLDILESMEPMVTEMEEMVQCMPPKVPMEKAETEEMEE